jgi:hypothetical protein
MTEEELKNEISHHEKACKVTAMAAARAAKKMAAKEVKAEVKEVKEVKKEVKEKKEVSPELKEKRLEALAKARAVRASRKADSGEERTIKSEIEKKKISK